MSGLPREVLKWIQSLDLAWQVKTPKWDMSNGYLVAEIFSWYFPQEIWMHSFTNGNSLESKDQNWWLLRNFITSKHIDIPEELILGTLHTKEGASAMLLERLYELFTNRKVKKVPADREPDFTDYAYQDKLPMHARATAAMSIKNNVRLTELKANKSYLQTAQKIQKIVNDHIDHRRLERIQDPKRFGIRPSLAERCVRKSIKQDKKSSQDDVTAPSDMEMSQQKEHTPIQMSEEPSDVSLPLAREHSVHFKEIQVQQMDKSNFYNMPIHGF